MHRPPAAEAAIAAELAVHRPDLGPRYAAELPGARAAVLTRLWRALTHEPLPWIAAHEAAGVLRLADGRRLHGPAPDPFATDGYVDAVRLDGAGYDDPARLMTDLGVPHAAGFAAELAHSTASLALSRANQGAPGEGWPVSDWEWEQRVVDGHPYHPNCRSRPGFSVAEQLAYGPEHRPEVRLSLVPVPVEECLVAGEWPEELRDGARLLIPVHPWQARHVLKRTADADLTARQLTDAARAARASAGAGRTAHPSTDAGLTAHPLMSLRTLALPGGGPHVKTALSARLTSSVRDISIGSVLASATLSAFAETVAARTGGLLHVTRTPGAATADSPDLAAVWRESPQRYAAPGERIVPVAALPFTGLPARQGWLADLARLCLTVGLQLLDLGVALEAHGQNLLVILSADGTPLRLVYRDLADIRVSPTRLARHGIALPDLPERILTDDVTALRGKLFGSLVAGALGATAGSRTALAEALEAAVPDLPPTGDLAALCEQPLPTKALTLMRLSPGVSGDQWAALPNPLKN
ncbi:iron transporter [Streptomyces sp. V2]|uniref:IucA/IucC family protein n=1 Tax=Streptomyces TaxID=1883 RepID=UPI0006EBAC08|nr:MULTISPECIES: IucA/IucC family siderophore biosynthesis protein [Streptomyces]PWG11274.1 iron transporter [Streptomyces sp. V2]